MKKRKSSERTTLGLIASGVTTIKIGQRMPRYRIVKTSDAIRRDRDAIVGDAKRAYRAITDREFA